MLTKLTALSPMKGIIGLKINKRPDFFKLPHFNQSYIVVVAEGNPHITMENFVSIKNKMTVDKKNTIAYYLRHFKSSS